MESRRNALKIIGAIGATCSFPFSANQLYAQHQHRGSVEAPLEPAAESPFTPSFFTPDEFEIVSRVSDLIIPETDTPGAVASGTPRYIDLTVHEDLELQDLFRNGIERLQKTSHAKFSRGFLQLSEAEQVAMLQPLSDASDQVKSEKQSGILAEVLWFRAIKNLTADGYYTSRAGLIQELGYDGNTALGAFPQFVIPEH
jgi:hypothetical protein